ncbi:hypothetical protein AK88_03430 [Plasmodium fragile]|uniref:Uncharacterized protein n=1 Tax=Plasmodium fragile TaxID=5857 RepID=A0A0D9QMF9_PLAFR|nr:uncharacterized protein AK88_03430 [Plasmodium fragile]KJP86921.1 hypothetical protein AK88_03430 [Plasmodium fragile]
MEEMRSLLDSLMGKDRNETDARKKHSFKDDNVCKYYLIDFCPHDLFHNTKSDIGRCKNIHSEVLKEQLANHEDYKYYRAKYEQKFMRTLENIIDLADHKIERTKEKLRYMSENSKNHVDKKEKIESISNHIEDLQKREEEAREKGDLVKADSFSSQVTTLQAEIKRLNEEPEKVAEPNLMVCEVCGAMKSPGDPITKLENHASGKQHIGFETIRSALTKLKDTVKEREQIIEKYRKEKYAHDEKSSRTERSHRDREHRRRSSSHRRSSKRHRSHDRNSRTHQSNRSKRSRKHSSSYRSRSSSWSRSRERHKERSSIEACLELQISWKGLNKDDSIKGAAEALKKKDAGKNVFETLHNLFLEEKESNKRKHEDLSEHIDKMKAYFDEKINSLKDNTHENLEELKYYLDQLNRNNKDKATDNNTFLDELEIVKNDVNKLKKEKEENINLIKTSMRTYFDKIKGMLSVMNANIESVREELATYKENNQIDNKKKNIEILQLINEENEALNKKMEESLNSLSSDICEATEQIINFKEHMENQVKDIKNETDMNKREMDEKTNELTTNQKKLLNDFYPSEMG